VAPTHDVLIVGGGGAGLRAAIAIAETNPRLRVAVLSKVYPMRSHTVSAEGGAAGVARADDSLDEHAYDTISGGDWMSDQDAVEAFVKEAPEELMRLEHWGCPWSRESDGHIAVRSVRRDEEDAHVVRRGQNRLPPSSHALPDVTQVHERR
jgi:fumarate reductase flavoprotein subunit